MNVAEMRARIGEATGARDIEAVCRIAYQALEEIDYLQAQHGVRTAKAKREYTLRDLEDRLDDARRVNDAHTVEVLTQLIAAKKKASGAAPVARKRGRPKKRKGQSGATQAARQEVEPEGAPPLA